MLNFIFGVSHSGQESLRRDTPLHGESIYECGELRKSIENAYITSGAGSGEGIRENFEMQEKNAY
jgi:hypothetical protein